MVHVDKEQKEEIDFYNSIIQGFFDRFVRYTDTRYMYWVDKLRIGDVVDYMLESVKKAQKYGQK